MKILIVDDKPANLLVLKETLSHLSASSVEFVEALGADDALTFLLHTEEPPVLAILDVQMPQMDGYELASVIKSHPRMRHMPIIFLSAIYNQSAHIIKGYESGAVDFLTKPINPYILRAKVDVFLKLEQYRCDIVQARLAHEQLVIEKAIWERLQLQMMQSQKMESLGRIVTGIAHEFNNILASILGYTDLAKVYVESASQSDACECLNQVEKAGQRCAGLIKGMLSYTGDAGLNVDKTIEPVNVAEVVSDVLTVFQLNLPDNIQIITTLNDLRSIRIDATELYQLLLNILLNAKDAIGSAQGTITVTLQSCVLPLSSLLCSECKQPSDSPVFNKTLCFMPVKEKYLELSISDTGEGIEPSELANIFEPFFTTKEVGKGVGLGLSVVSGLVHKANGHILVDSQINVGSTLKVVFPPAL